MEKDKIVVGYLSPSSPNDRRASSGSLYTIAHSLQLIDGVELLWIPISYDSIWEKITWYIHAIKRRFHINIPISFSKKQACFVSSSINLNLVEQCDILFCAFQAPALYGLKTNKPIVYLSDTTYSLMVDYYYHGISKNEIRAKNEIEQVALNKSTSIILSSQWAANSAINEYHQPKEKVNVVEFGANIDEKDIISHDFNYDGHLDILFLGVDWERKGGKIAVDTCEWLNKNGISSTLHIVGIREIDESIKNLSFVNFIGFLDKNDKKQYNQLVTIIKKCHCLLLPTLAECAGIVFCEASANGLPVFSHITGGVPNYVNDGINGHLLPVGSNGEDFGKIIKQSFESGELKKMSESSVALYKEKFNWNCWRKKVEIILRQQQNQL